MNITYNMPKNMKELKEAKEMLDYWEKNPEKMKEYMKKGKEAIKQMQKCADEIENEG